MSNEYTETEKEIVQSILSKALVDKTFRKNLVENPKSILESEGVLEKLQEKIVEGFQVFQEDDFDKISKDDIDNLTADTKRSAFTVFTCSAA